MTTTQQQQQQSTIQPDASSVRQSTSASHHQTNGTTLIAGDHPRPLTGPSDPSEQLSQQYHNSVMMNGDTGQTFVGEGHSSGNKSSEGEGQSSSSSSSNSAAAHAVTATTGSSDDKGGANHHHNNSSSDGDGDKKLPALNPVLHHRHHHRRTHTSDRNPNNNSSNPPPPPAPPLATIHGGGEVVAAAATVDERACLTAAVVDNSRHTTVVAHLPLPDSSDTGLSGSEDAKLFRDADLVEPRKEPGFHKIKSTFKRLVRQEEEMEAAASEGASRPQDEVVSSSPSHKSPRKASKRQFQQQSKKKKPSPESKSLDRGLDSGGDTSSEDNGAGTNGSSSGSGTEGGYAGSASSNDNAPRVECSSSPSVSSSEDLRRSSKRNKNKVASSASDHASRPLLTRKTESNLSMSSDIADFSSGATESKVAETMKALRESNESSAESITSCSNNSNNGDSGSDDLEDGPKVRVARASSSRTDRKRRAPGHWPRSLQLPSAGRERVHNNNNGSSGHHNQGRIYHHNNKHAVGYAKDDSASLECTRAKPPIMTVGSDVMAHILTFLEPPEILSVLTMPLSKDWLSIFTRQSELWRVLCILEPFKACVEEEGANDASDGSLDSFSLNLESELGRRFGKFRILYTSFVRCMRYLARIKDDALNGRPPSVIDYGAGEAASSGHNISSNQNLQSFLARARGVALQHGRQQSPPPNHHHQARAGDSLTESSDEEPAAVARAEPIGVSDDGSSTEAHKPKKAKRSREKEDKHSNNNNNKRRKVRYAASKLTQRLLLPAGGVATQSELPWSCAIYSIVNWMVGFADVEGIQTMCLKVLPFLLEDEQQRMTAQRAGLTDVVLRDMVMFPNSCELHTAAFHTIVLLARPLGGREGMLFHTSMVNSTGIFNSTMGNGGAVANGKNGIAVMLDSMRRFQSDEALQAMSCWSLVNIALAPSQKNVLISLGGIEVTTNAMVSHPHSAEVQFRSLFALINLVIPCVARGGQEGQHETGTEESAEKEILDDMVEPIVELVVKAMKNFCSSESILNRACLVLHNLSLTQEYHGALLWTPNCYQMLEWCLSNYRTDQVLQQSAAGTLHRLQLTLSTSESLRARFHAALASQQQVSLERAHREAVMLHEQQNEQLQSAPDHDGR